MAKLLALDLDGTLFYPKQARHCVPLKNVRFLRHWIDAGNRVVLVTSRSHVFTSRLEKEIGRPFDVINCTSCQIWTEGKLIRDVTMPREYLKSILDRIAKKYHPVAYLMTSKKYPLVVKNVAGIGRFLMGFYWLWYFFQFKYREPYVLGNGAFDEELESGDIYKVMIFFGFGRNKKELSLHINKALREEYPGLESSWTDIVNELTPIDCHKGSGLNYYCDALGIKASDVYVVGDSGNDISMFKDYHENSYCMSHAYPNVKKYAKHTIPRVYKLEKLVLKGETNHESD